jgi:hypothetical protein
LGTPPLVAGGAPATGPKRAATRLPAVVSINASVDVTDAPC